MPRSGAHWWMYLAAALFIVTFVFNARQEFWGPESGGWVPEPTLFTVASVFPRGPMDKAGVHAGDTLESVDGYVLNGAGNWFLARAHFERNRPIYLRVRRGEEHIALTLIVTEPAWRTWRGSQFLATIALQVARSALLLLAMFVGFSRPHQPSARFAALIFAIGSVMEGYPSAGWAAALHHLPAALAVPIGLITASGILAGVVWLLFFASFPRPWLSQGLRWLLAAVPGVLFGVPMVASVIALIYRPSALARPWPVVLSAASVRLIQDVAGVIPLLFLNRFPMYRPIAQIRLLEVWFVMTLIYFAASCLFPIVGYHRLNHPRQRRSVRALLLVQVLLSLFVLHNVLVRNWAVWFGSKPPSLFSDAGFVFAALLLLAVPLTLTYCVLVDAKTE